MEQIFKEGAYLLTGESKFYLKEGSINIIGKEVMKDEEIFVPKGKRVIVSVKKESLLEISDHSSVELSKEPAIFPKYDNLVKKIISENIKVILILGNVDTGKTFLTTYLANKLSKSKKNVCVIDLDPGQSDIGPPTTFGTTFIKEPVIFLNQVSPSCLYFIGDTSLDSHIYEAILGIEKLFNKVASHADTVILNTPGWVFGEGAIRLIDAELKILSPELVILLEREDELKGLVRNFDKDKIFSLKVSSDVCFRNPSERKMLREDAYRRYFKDATEILLDCNSVDVEPIELLKGDLELVGLLVAFYDKNNEVLGVGMIKEVNGQNFVIITPLKKEEPISSLRPRLSYGIKKLQLGYIKITSQGEEIGRI